MTALQVRIPAVSIDSDIANDTAGVAFAIPYSKQGIDLAYQLVYTGGPSAVSVALQVSMDNSNWVTVDASTVTAGEYVNVTGIVALLVRLYHTSRTGGTKVTGSILMGGV